LETTIEKIRDEDVGELVKVAGVVAVEPGILGTQYFYLVSPPDANTSSTVGVQIYMYKKDFPKLAVGDLVEVQGELAQTNGETRIKLSQKSDIKKVDYAGEPEPNIIDVAEVGEAFEGQLVQVGGEITELKGSYMYVDDGSGEIKVYFKTNTGIDKKILQIGNVVSVTGIVQQTKDAYQILPRSQTDIIKTGVTEELVSKTELQTQDQQKEVAEKYLTATAGGLTSILFGLAVKSKGGMLFGGLLKKFAGVGLIMFKKKK